MIDGYKGNLDFSPHLNNFKINYGNCVGRINKNKFKAGQFKRNLKIKGNKNFKPREN